MEVTQFYGHIFGSATIPFKIGPIPFEADADVLISVDADRDGQPLGDLRMPRICLTCSTAIFPK